MFHLQCRKPEPPRCRAWITTAPPPLGWQKNKKNNQMKSSGESSHPCRAIPRVSNYENKNRFVINPAHGRRVTHSTLFVKGH
ncbi:hypothetical protein GDO81_023465 [Engystomops pustulosus]|uniref:Uncharacterized protein n=1 Tax=Engystomops pustulosus TaxID=76066 RepID=A0AAV6YLB0_ENGPU|nr:hypothetical protein GDO81_023465 [Engystomops pustulosus]